MSAPRLRRLLLSALLAVGLVAVSACGAALPAPTAATTGSPTATTGSPTAATGSPTAAADDFGDDVPPDDPRRQFYDNVDLFVTAWSSLPKTPRSWQSVPDYDVWSRATEEERETVVDLGHDACAGPVLGPGEKGANSDVLWFAATFLCPDRLEEVEATYKTPMDKKSLKSLKLSLLTGDVSSEKVMLADAMCTYSVPIHYDLPPKTISPELFCWLVRVNVIAGSGTDKDWVGLFKGQDEPSDKMSKDFDAYAVALGATPSKRG